jgi:hypothetical protein
VASRDARVLVQLNGAADVERAAKPRVGVGDDGEVGVERGDLRDLGELADRHDRQVGLANG